jgi:two-component sensor histidine kinase
MELADVYLDISKAYPIGMILNEAITNSIKYAFPGKNEGMIAISIKRNGDMLIFTVSDNGIGLPANFDISKANTLGMKLMKGLSDDIEARFTAKSDHGTQIIIEFRSD